VRLNIILNVSSSTHSSYDAVYAVFAQICDSSDESIVDVVAHGNEGFSNFLTRLRRVCPGRLCPIDDTQADAIQNIQTEGPYIVFVPTEEAFGMLLGDVKPRDLLRNEEIVDNLQGILAYHVVEDGATCTDRLTQGPVQTLLPGGDVDVVVEGDTASLVDGSGRQVGIIDRIPASSAGRVRILLPETHQI
jgi:uncharacterized surface protein with fasciclin (FAS1) repeats